MPEKNRKVLHWMSFLIDIVFGVLEASFKFCFNETKENNKIW